MDERVTRIEVSKDSSGEVWACLVGSQGGQIAAPAQVLFGAVRHLGAIVAKQSGTAGTWRQVERLGAPGLRPR